MDRDKVRDVFNDALDERTDERRAFVEVSCEDDPDMLREVESLLDAHERVSSFLNESPIPWSGAKMFADALEVQEVSVVGERVGRYRVEKLLARGGMGSVYLGSRDDGTFVKNVAIKLLRFGTDNASVATRFGRERQILADLDHPNIARLLDAGTTDTGIPYLIMEYVDGTRIDEYCREHDLDTRQRLRLISEVCSAVSFAHEHGVVHRDIKPSNILVTAEGRPKLLDFGIAKLIHRDPTQTLTLTEMQPMTLKYASPEQVRGDEAGVASDQYSLGVVAYQLLSGHLPYHLDNVSPYEVLQAICDSEPMPLTGHGASADVDAIFSTTLQKKPSHRYASLNELREDIGRYLRGVPISIRPRGMQRWTLSSNVLFSVVFIAALIAVIAGSVVWSGLQRSAGAQSNAAAERVATTGSVPADPDAAAHFMRGEHLWNNRTPDEIRSAIDEFSIAIGKEPDFAGSYSGLANCYILLGAFGQADPKDAFDRARTASARGIELAPDRADVHLSMAMIRWLYDCDWDAAEQEFARARSLDPNYTLAPHWHGLFLGEMGRFDEAINEEKAALQLEPLSPSITADLARVYYYARRYKEAAQQYQRMRLLNPNYYGATGEMIEFYEAAGDSARWSAIFENAPSEFLRAFRVGGIAGARRWQARTDRQPVDLEYGGVHDLTNSERNEVFAALNDAYQHRQHWLAQLKVSPRFDNLRSDPRFDELLQRMNLR